MNIEKPWLISSELDLRQDELQSKKYRKKYESSHPFPGVNSSIEQKMQWVEDLNSTYEDIMEDGFFQASAAPNPMDFAKEVLYQHCPQNLRVDIVVEWEKFQSVAEAMKDDEKELFFKNIPNYLSDSDTKWKTFEDSLAHLSEKYKLPSSKSTGEGEGEGEVEDGHDMDMVVIASQIFRKDCKAIDEMNKIIKTIGLTPYVSGAVGSSVENSNWLWGLDETLGKNMYAQDNDEDEAGVYWRMFLKFHEAHEHMTDIEKAEKVYTAELQSKIEESEIRNKPKIYVLLKRKDIKKKANEKDEDVDEDEDEDEYDDEDEDEEENIPTTPDFVQPLWVPQSYSQHYRRIEPHFHNGEGEVIEIQQRLEKGNTDTGNLKIMLFEYELDYVKTLPSVQEKFGAALALTKVAQDDNYWMLDNENSKQVEKLVKNLADLWKNELLQYDDDSLGLGLEDSTCTDEGEVQVDEDGLSSSRRLLYDFLEVMAKEYRCEEDIKFDWRPKKRKAAAASESGTTSKKKK